MKIPRGDIDGVGKVRATRYDSGTALHERDVPHGRGEGRWFVLNRPRCDTNEGIELEVTVTSEQKREEKATSSEGAGKEKEKGTEMMVGIKKTAMRHRRGE